MTDRAFTLVRENQPHEATFVEVRCCCQPQKLLGWLAVPRGLPVVAGGRVAFMLQPVPFVCERGVLTVLERLTLPLLRYTDSVGDHVLEGLAFKAEEVPLWKLRRIPGFVPA